MWVGCFGAGGAVVIVGVGMCSDSSLNSSSGSGESIGSSVYWDRGAIDGVGLGSGSVELGGVVFFGFRAPK